MNLDEQIAIRLPFLRQAHRKEQLALGKKRLRFIQDYSIERLRTLPLERFVIGRGDPKTFCYRVERELDGLGRILGSSASKFGVYYNKKSSSYKHAKRWGITLDDAYQRIRSAVIKLLEDGRAGNVEELERSPISPMFKGKLLHLYLPDTFAPVYSPDHLKHFAVCLNLPEIGTSSVNRQMALMEFRNSSLLLRAEPPGLTMSFLYAEFPIPGGDDGGAADDGERAPDVPLSEAVEGMELLDALSGIGGKGDPMPPKPGKYDDHNGRRKYIGDRGEALVVEFERRRLTQAQRPDLAERIEHVAATDDTRGYDILSFEANGSERPIEVKSTSGNGAAAGFYLTANELDASRRQPNYHLYLVFQALGAKPKLFIVSKPKIESEQFEIRPTQFHVTFKIL